MNSRPGRENIFRLVPCYNFMLKWNTYTVGTAQEFRREGWTETAIILCKLNNRL